MMNMIMKTRLIVTISILFTVLTLFAPKPAHAICCKCDQEIEKFMEDVWLNGIDLLFWKDPTAVKTIRHIEGEFATHKQWIAGVVWEDNILPAMMMMTDEVINVGMKQMEMIGGLFDAKIQLDTQRAMQVEHAKIHKLYHPSMGICEIGTSVKSIAASDKRAEMNNIVISKRARNRHLGHAFTASFTGKDNDRRSRKAQFLETHCRKADNKNGMSVLCKDSFPSNMTNYAQRNRDIDYTRLLETPWTLNVDLTDDHLTQHEEDVFALATNIYGHNIIRRPLAKFMQSAEKQKITEIQAEYMNARSLIAKRNIAENSFNAIAGMKSSGASGSREYLINLLGELGLDVDEGLAQTNINKNFAGRLLGNEDPNDADNADFRKRANPSYYAQMEILTKKMFQNPDFYTSLYDKPANVDRKSVALQAIGLMQKFDVFKSYLRQEAAVSILLELAVMDMQEEIENKIPK